MKFIAADLMKRHVSLSTLISVAGISAISARLLGLVSRRDYHPHGPDNQKDLLVKSSCLKNYARSAVSRKDESP